MSPARIVALLLLGASLGAAAQSGPPQEVSGPRPTDPNVELIKRVQERLHVDGYDIGPVNGVLDERTQAALAQFQLSRNLPAGAQLDDQTLAELGVDMAEVQVMRAASQQPDSASVGQTAEPKN